MSNVFLCLYFQIHVTWRAFIPIDDSYIQWKQDTRK